MPNEIIVPRLGWSMEEGVFVSWLKNDGDFVQAGDLLFSIEGDKAIQEIESIDSGILRIAPNCPKAGEPIRVGDVLGHLLSANEVVTPSARAKTLTPSTTPSAGSSVKATTGQRPASIGATKPAQPVQAAGRSPTDQLPTISPRALRVAGELGVEWSNLRGSGRTGRIRERDIRAAAGTKDAEVTISSGSGAQPAVLVTGGCGFVGTWVVRELLARRLRVVVIDTEERPPRWSRVLGRTGESVALVRGSLLDRELLARVFREKEISYVIHLAAMLTPACQSDPWEGCRVNVLGSVALFEEMRAMLGRVRGFSYASSVAIFGDDSEESGVPPTFYGAFKKSVELIAAQYWRWFQIASVGIRPQVAYGPERDSGLTAGPSLAARAAARGESYCIGYTGRVGYDYVEDVARAFVRGALETPPGAQVVDLSGESAEVNQVIALIDAALPGAAARLAAKGPPVPAHAPPSPRSISTLYPDWTTTSLAEGVRRTVAFYRGN